MEIIKTNIDGPLIIEPKVFGDSRGYFFESFNAREFREKTGLDITFVQDNESMSTYGVMWRFLRKVTPCVRFKVTPLSDFKMTPSFRFKVTPIFRLKLTPCEI